MKLEESKGRRKLKKKKLINSPHIYSTERWLVIPPVDGKEPLAFFNESKAIEVATAIAINIGAGVEIDHQVKDESGEWVSS